MTELSAVVVTHRSSAEAIAAIGSLRRAFAAEGIAGEVVLVDCGSEAGDRAILATAEADRLIPIENRGYAGGVNAGIAASRGRMLLLCNADVVFAPGALASLLDAAARTGIGAAAPVQHADPEGRVLLPTGFGAGLARDFGQALGARAGASSRFARRARRQWRLWEEGGETDYLAGSILALRREVVDRIGRFDERFPFEFEETEWEDRARAAGFRLVVVAASRARHAAGTSAGRNPETARRRERSRRLYRRRRYGRAATAVLAAAESLLRPPPDGVAPLSGCVAADPGRALAFSPNPSVLPFAGVPLSRPVDAGAVARALGGPMYVRAFGTSDGVPGPLGRVVP